MCSAFSGSASSKVSYAVKYLNEPQTNVIDCSLFDRNNIKLYDNGTTYNTVPISLPERVDYLLNLEKYEFSINNTNYILYPMVMFIQIRNGKEKCLGYFDSIETQNNAVVLKYVGGDKAADGSQRYVYVDILPGATSYAKRNLKNGSESYGFKLYIEELMGKEEIVNIGYYMENEKGSKEPTMLEAYVTKEQEEMLVGAEKPAKTDQIIYINNLKELFQTDNATSKEENVTKSSITVEEAANIPAGDFIFVPFDSNGVTVDKKANGAVSDKGSNLKRNITSTDDKEISKNIKEKINETDENKIIEKHINNTNETIENKNNITDEIKKETTPIENIKDNVPVENIKGNVPVEYGTKKMLDEEKPGSQSEGIQGTASENEAIQDALDNIADEGEDENNSEMKIPKKEIL